MYASVLVTPIGQVVIKANDLAVYSIGLPEMIHDEFPNELTNRASSQLAEYFNGDRQQFDFAVEQPGSDFQQTVWKELLGLEVGKPISYASLSKKMNSPLAIRAIAAASGKNNLMIVIPCHRVIGSNGKLVGYAGGLWRKKWLLNHEVSMSGTGQSSLIF